MKTTYALQLLIILFFSAISPADPTELIDIFSSEVDPGEGNVVEVTIGEPKEDKFGFGKEEGRYGMGMLLPNKTLGTKAQKDFKDLGILQIALGNLKVKTDEGVVPQFGTASLFLAKLPTSTTAFEVIHSPTKQQNWDKSVLIWYTTPNSPTASGDEEKLRNTYFGTFGKISLTPVDIGKEIAVKSTAGRLAFTRHLYQFDFDVTLSTPFSSTKKKLTGSLRVPIFSPKGKPAEDFSRKIASATPEGIETFMPPKKADSGTEKPAKKSKKKKNP